MHENNREVDLVDSKSSKFNEEEVKRLIGVSLLCTQASPTFRPSMSHVVAMLFGDIEVSTVTSRPGYLTDWKYDDITKVTSEGATDTSYLKPLKKKKKSLAKLMKKKKSILSIDHL